MLFTVAVVYCLGSGNFWMRFLQDSDMPRKKLQHDTKYIESFEETPLLIAIITYISYGILIIFGHIRDLLRKCHIEKVPLASEYLAEVNS